MQDDLKNILSNAKGELNQDQLIKYLNDELKQAERHDLEKEIANDLFEADALEGLEQLEHKEKIELIVDDLNRNLKKKMAKKTAARERMKLKPQWTLYFSILILLILISLIYLFLHKQGQP